MLSLSKGPEKGRCQGPSGNKESGEAPRETSCPASIFLRLVSKLQLTRTLTQLSTTNINSNNELQTLKNVFFTRLLLRDTADDPLILQSSVHSSLPSSTPPSTGPITKHSSTKTAETAAFLVKDGEKLKMRILPCETRMIPRVKKLEEK